MSWRDLAACNDFDPNLFFPAGDTGVAASQIVEAKRICGECPVKTDCLAYAVEANQVNGVWGGTTEQERRLVRRRWMSARRRNDSAAMMHVLEAV
ncbi:MAG: WhiB family transcriptional regulator [Acidimicrobiia bacterium]|nr:WhiB family transcriptional regulator [Acidimicrobiia bacterium]